MSAESNRAIGLRDEENRIRARGYIAELEEVLKFLRVAADVTIPFPTTAQGQLGRWMGGNWPSQDELRRFIADAKETRIALAKAYQDLGGSPR